MTFTIFVVLLVLLITWLLNFGRRHKGWRYTDRHGCSRRCIGCGEEQTLYTLWCEPPVRDWWETTNSGDGSCGTEELPPRWGY